MQDVLPHHLDGCRLTVSLNHTSLTQQQATELETDSNIKLRCSDQGIKLQVAIHISHLLENLECGETKTREFKVQTLR